MTLRLLRRWVLPAGAIALSVVLAACGTESEVDLLESARASLLKDDHRTAVVQLKKLLQKNPQRAEARFLMGKALLESGNAQAATLELQKARELKYSEDELLPVLVNAMLAEGKARTVSEMFGSTRLNTPAAESALQAGLAMAFVDQGKLDLADARIEASLQADRKNRSARMLKVRRIAGQGRFADALTLVQALVTDDPKDVQALTLQAELLWVAKQDRAGAAALLNQVLTIEPAHVRAHTLLIQMDLERKDVAAFKDRVKSLSQLAPRSFEAMFYQTQAAYMDGDSARAREGAQQLLKLAPEHGPVLHLAGAVEVLTGEMELATKHLAQAIAAMPNTPGPRRLLAELQFRSGQFDKGLTTLGPLLSGAKPDAEALGIAAEAHLGAGDIEKAQALYKRAALADPADSRPRVALALVQMRSGDVANGIEQLRLLAATDPASHSDLALIGALVQRQQFEPALQALDKLQAKAPNRALPHLLRARVLLEQQKPAEARASLERAIALDPNYFAAELQLAGLDVDQGKPKDALRRIEEFAKRQPRNVEAALAAAELARRTGATAAELERRLVAVVQALPAEAAPRLALVQHYLGQRQSKAAVSAAQDASTALPGDARIFDALGEANLAAGDTQQALGAFRKAIALQPNSPLPHLRLAELHVARKDYVAATKSLNTALELAPGLLAAQSLLIKVEMGRKKPDEALRIAREVQKQRPRDAVGYLLQADVHFVQQDLAAGTDALRKAFDIAPATPLATRLHSAYVRGGRAQEAETLAASWQQRHPRDAEFIFYLGSMAMQRKDYGAAEKLYRQLLAMVPDNAGSLNNLALTQIRQNKPEGLDLARKAQALRPDDAAIMDTLALALVAAGQPAEALEWQRKAVARDPGTPLYRFNLANVLIAAGNREQARAELDKLATLGGRFAKHAEVIALLKSL